MSKIASVSFFSGRATLFYEGADILSDYCPCYSRISAAKALEEIKADGTTPGAYVSWTNARMPGEALRDDMLRARKFADKSGLAFRDNIYFPLRASEAEAQADALAEPGQKCIIMHGGEGHVFNYTTEQDEYPAETWRAVPEAKRRDDFPAVPPRPELVR